MANVPVAARGVLGAVQTNGMGIAVNTKGELYISQASSGNAKSGNNNFAPVTPTRQHESVFYGLAKAAGDTTQSQSDNTVGTYTTEAKAAIQTMLDVPAKADIPEVPVQDVQINGTSILSNGVANVPLADSSTFGVVKPGAGLMVSDNVLTVAMAPSDAIKAGTNMGNFLRPGRQHESVFYGLAKAAGDTTQSQSSNAVGTYTNEAKAAIQTMLDVPSNATVTSAIGTAIGNVH